jgi:hypothetical protein
MHHQRGPLGQRVLAAAIASAGCMQSAILPGCRCAQASGATGQSRGVLLHRETRGVDGLGYDCARPRRWANQGKGRQDLWRYGPIGCRRDPLVAGTGCRRREAAVPNAATRAAMVEAEEGAGASFDTVADLMSDLNAEN